MTARLLSCALVIAAMCVPLHVRGQVGSPYVPSVLPHDHGLLQAHSTRDATGQPSLGLASVHYQGAAGQGSRWVLGAILGFAVGTGVAYAVWHSLWYTYGCEEGVNQDAQYSEADCFSRALVTGGVPGALLGGLIGYQIKTSRFEATPRLDVVPGSGSVFAGVTLSF